MSIPAAWQRQERELTRPMRRAGDEEEAWKARRRISHRGKTLRAFEAYLDLLDTAAYLQSELSSQLAAYDDFAGVAGAPYGVPAGPTATRVVANKLKCSRSNVEKVVRPLEERGWLVRHVLSEAREGGEVVDEGAGRARAGDVEPVAVEIEEGGCGEVCERDSDVRR